MIKKVILVTSLLTLVYLNGDSMPQNAKYGQCFTKTFYPPKYKKTTRINSTKRVIINDSSFRYEVLPAKFSWHKERVKVEDEVEKIIVTPARYKTIYKKILIKASEKIWKRSLNINSEKAFNSCVNSASSSGMDVENAKVGTCYYEHYEPKKYITTVEKILTSEPSERISVTPAKYRVYRKKIITDSTNAKLIPSVSVYTSVKEKVTIQPAHTEWRKTTCQDRGCNQSEIVCLIEVPRTYKEVTKKILLQPAVQKKLSVEPIFKILNIKELVEPEKEHILDIPARYKSISKREKVSEDRYFWSDSSLKNSKTRLTSECNKICLTKTLPEYKKVAQKVVVTPATTKRVVTPAKYRVVKVKKIEREAKFKKVVIPAEYVTVETERERTKGYSKWMPVICEDAMSSTIIKKIQTALTNEGFYHGEVDGIWDIESKKSAREYQKSKGIGVTSKLSIETMKSLDIY